MTKHSRDGAYQLTDSDSHRAYYDSWSPSYNSDFADPSGYILPQQLVPKFLERAGPEDSPVLDIGCGTGLVGIAFAESGITIDGMDISNGMLSEAKRTGAYRDLFQADLTDTSSLPKSRYGGLVSCGTFTIGHLGPDYLETTLQMARPGALCAIAVNQLHFDTEGFSSMLDSLVESKVVTPPEFPIVPIYETTEIRTEPIDLAIVVVLRVSCDTTDCVVEEV